MTRPALVTVLASERRLWYLVALFDLHGSCGAHITPGGGVSSYVRIGIRNDKLRAFVRRTYGGTITRRSVMWYGDAARELIRTITPCLRVKHSLGLAWLALSTLGGRRGKKTGRLTPANVAARAHLLEAVRREQRLAMEADE